MGLIKFWNKKMKVLDWKDIALIKFSVAAFILMIAKLWNPILDLKWYWYGLIFLVTVVRPFYKVYLK